MPFYIQDTSGTHVQGPFADRETADAVLNTLRADGDETEYTIAEEESASDETQAQVEGSVPDQESAA